MLALALILCVALALTIRPRSDARRYPLHLADGSAQYDYFVMRSANLPSLHVTLDGKLD